MKIKFKKIKIDTGYHLLIKLKINDQEAVFVIDTGASNTVMDLEASKRFISKEKIKQEGKLSSGLGTNKMSSALSKKQFLEIGKLKFKHPLVILDLHHINSSYQSLGYNSIDGVLGCDILVKFNAVINIKTKELILRK